MKAASGCKVAYDIRANVGLMSLFLVEAMRPDGIVFAFEPASREVAAIRDLIACNRLGKRVRILRRAVCDEDGIVRFGPDGLVGILDKAPESHSDPKSLAIDVASTSLDSFVHGSPGNPVPDILKIDVESAEALVLRGAQRLLRERKPKMLIEVHGPDACRDSMEELLVHGYRVLGISGRTRSAVPRAAATLVPEKSMDRSPSCRLIRRP